MEISHKSPNRKISLQSPTCNFFFINSLLTTPRKMPTKRGCTYSRSPKGHCRSAVAHYAHTNGTGRKSGCTYGRRKGRCLSKKAADSRKRAAAKKIQKAYRSRRSK